MTRSRAFWHGCRDGAPFLIIIVPFSMLFGVVARDAGLDVLQTLSMSALVVAGAAQFTAIALLQDNAPMFVALFTALAVNLRLAMYSAALVPHLGRAALGARVLVAYLLVDQSYAVAARTYEAEPDRPTSVKLAYFLGCMSLIAPSWYGFTVFGAIIGRTLPPQLSLDFAVPACFVALLAPMLRSVPHLVTAFVSVVGVVAFAWIPWSLGLILAAALAMIAGARVELLLDRRAGGDA